jgi:uncharacterized protein (DUF433 family)
MKWEERIESNPRVLGGKPVLKGTRIAVEFVIELLARGWSVEDVLREYDQLALEDVQACLSHAADAH